MLVDSHCHLADPAFEADREAVLARARDAGVGHVVVVGENPERSDAARAIARAHRRCSATAGLHPHEARRWSAVVERRLADAAADPVVVAVGETGLDYHYDHSPRERQREAFDAQLDLGTRTGKPVVVHAREADEDVARLLRNHPQAVAILHSYSSGPELLRTGVALGHYVSWSGMITFRSWTADALLHEVPEDRLLIETDAPYLAPVPHRGKRNEPAFVGRVAERLAAVLERDPDHIAAVTTANARRVFGPRVRPDEESP